MLGLGHPAKEFGHDRLPVGCGQPIEGGDHFGCGATHVLVFRSKGPLAGDFCRSIPPLLR